MLTLFTGRFEDLLPSQQKAIHQLTVHRYVEDIYHLHTHLQQFFEIMSTQKTYRNISDLIVTHKPVVDESRS